jgi:hypothetical protein
MHKTEAQMVRDAYNRSDREDHSVMKLNDQEYLVKNYTNNSSYIVEVDDNFIYNCSCPHHVYREVICKHMISVYYKTNKQIY